MKNWGIGMVMLAGAGVSLSFIAKENTSENVVSCSSSTAGPSGKKTWIEPDSVFVKMAASSGMMEVELGKQAQQKAASAEVRNYGAMMVQDHTKANDELMAIASAKGMMVPPMMLPKHQMHVNHLTALTGDAFDKAYITMMVKAHKDDIDEFEDASKKAADADIKAFAAKQLPVLVMHNTQAKTVKKTMKGSKKGNMAASSSAM